MQPTPPLDHIRVRILTLADHAAGPPDQKLYINGAGIHGVPMPNVPGPIMTPLSLIIRLYVPYPQTTEPHSIVVRILDEDSNPVGPDPIIDAPNVELGRAPGTRAGDENAVSLVIGLTGYPVNREFDAELRLLVHVDVDGDNLDRLPFKLLRVQPRPLGPAR